MLSDSIMKVMFLQVRLTFLEWYLHICLIYYILIYYILVPVQIAIVMTLFGKLIIIVFVDFNLGLSEKKTNLSKPLKQ